MSETWVLFKDEKHPSEPALHSGGGPGGPDPPLGSAALTELGQYLFISSLMAISFLCSFGPVWYQPTILSLAEQKREGFPVRAPREAPAGAESANRGRNPVA